MRQLILAALLATASPAWAEDAPEHKLSDWQQKKCATFTQAYEAALQQLGTDDLRPEFLASQQAFMDSQCMDRKTLSPALGKELEIANIVSLEMIHLGASGTFLPYDCR